MCLGATGEDTNLMNIHEGQATWDEVTDLGISGISNKVVQEPLHHPGGISFTWMHTGSHHDRFAMLRKNQLKELKNSAQIREIVHSLPLLQMGLWLGRWWSARRPSYQPVTDITLAACRFWIWLDRLQCCLGSPAECSKQTVREHAFGHLGSMY